MIRYIPFFFFILASLSANGQTVLVDDAAGFSHGDSDSVTENNYFANISNCYKIEFSFDFAFSDTWEGSGNMEIQSDCPLCNGDPDGQTAGCGTCWDFLRTRLFLDNIVTFEDLVGETGTTDAEQFGTYSEAYCVDADDLELRINSQTWAPDEIVDITNILILCYEKDLDLSTNSPICDGETLDLDATTTVPGSEIDTYEWMTSGGATIDDTSVPNTTATEVSDGDQFTMTITTIDGCSWDEAIDVNVDPTPTIAVTGPSFLCEGACGPMMITIVDGTGDYDIEFDWMGTTYTIPSVTNGNTNIDICYNSTAGIELTTPGTGQITITDVITNAGCPPIPPYDEFDITLSPAPDTPEDLTLTECPEPGEIYAIFDLTTLNYTTDAPPGSTYTLYESNGIEIIDPLDYNFYQANDGTTLWFSVTSTDGCTSQLTSFELFVENAPFLFPEIEVCDISDVILTDYDDIVNNDIGIIITWHDGEPSINNPGLTEIPNSSISTDLTLITLWVMVDDGTCVNYALVNITEITCGCQDPAVIDNLTADNVICEGEVINLTASISGGATGGTWSVMPAMGSFDNDTDLITTFTPSASGNYTFTFTTDDPDGAGTACMAATQMVTTNVIETPPPPTVMNVTYCEGDQATELTAVGNDLLWYTTATGGTGSATAPTPSAATVGITSYWVSQTVNGCESERVEIIVTISPCTCPNEAIINTITASNNPMCMNETTTLSVTISGGATGGTWTVAPNTGTFADGPNPLDTLWAPNAPGTYTFTFTTNDPDGADTQCEAAVSTIQVVVNPQPSPPATTPLNFCINDATAPLTATGDNLQWYTTATGGTGSATAPTPLSATVGVTSYWVTQTVNGCESERAEINVTIDPCDCDNPPMIDVINSDKTEICLGESVDLMVVTTNANSMGTWTSDLSGSFGTPTALNTTFTPDNIGTYTITYTTIDPDGTDPCMSVSADIVIEVTSQLSANTPEPIILCGGQKNVDLTLYDDQINPDAQIYWFNDADATDPILDPFSYMIPTFEDVTVYAQAGSGLCASALVPLVINYQDYVFNNPGAITICENTDILNLTDYEDLITTSETITWYEDMLGNILINNPATFDITGLDPMVVYFSVGDGVCRSNAIPLLINEIEGVTIDSVDYTCDSDYQVILGGMTFDLINNSGQAMVDGVGGDCDTTYNVTINPIEPVYEAVTYTLCPGDTEMIADIVINHGDNDFDYTLQNGSIATGCDSIINITILSLEPIESDLTLQGCAGAPFIYEGITFTETDDTGTLTLDNQASNGCDSIINITVDFVDEITENFPIMLCQGQDTMILGQNITSGSGTTPIMVPGGTLNNGCDSILNVIVTELNPSSSSIQETFCDLTQTIVVGSETFDINNPIGSATIPNAVGCDSVVNVMLEYIELDFILESEPACMNQEEYNLFISELLPAEGFFDVMLDGVYIQTIAAADIPFAISTNLLNGTVEIEDANGCTSSANYSIAEDTVPEAIISQDDYQLSVELIGITEESIDSVRWTPADMVECATCLSTNIDTITIPTSFNIEIFYGGGCSFEKTILAIPLLEKKTIYTFPNIISDSRGNNNFFVPMLENSTDRVTEMYIYDRWGNLMFSSTDEEYLSNEGGWNGRYGIDGKRVSLGAYVYLVKIKSLSGDEVTYTGDVTVYE